MDAICVLCLYYVAASALQQNRTIIKINYTLRGMNIYQVKNTFTASLTAQLYLRTMDFLLSDDTNTGCTVGWVIL